MDTNYVLDGVTSGTDSFTLNLININRCKGGRYIRNCKNFQTTFDAEDSTQEATFETASKRFLLAQKSVNPNKIELESDNPPLTLKILDGVITKFRSSKSYRC